MTDDERIERALKSIGDAYVRDNPPDYPTFREGVMRRQRRRRFFQAGSAVALAGAAVAVGLFITSTAPPLDKPTSPAARGRNVDDAITEKVDVAEGPSQINVGRDAVWVTSKSGNVTRIDPSTRAPKIIPVGGLPTDLAVGGSGVWIANNGRLQRLELDGDKVKETFDITAGTVPMHVSISPGAVWVVVSGREVFKVDPATGDPTSFPAGPNPVDIAVADGVLWALDLSGYIQGYDVRSGDPVGDEIDVREGEDAEITLGSKALWYGVNGEPTFTRIDLETRLVSTTTLSSDYVDVGVGQGEVWVLTTGTDVTGTFAAVDPETGALEGGGLNAVTGSPVDIAVGQQALWLVDATGDQALRISKSEL